MEERHEENPQEEESSSEFDFDEGELTRLLEAPTWDLAHQALDSEADSGNNSTGFFIIIPLWLFARDELGLEQEEGEGDETVEENESDQPNNDLIPTPTLTSAPTLQSLPRQILSSILSYLSHSSPRSNPYSWLPTTLVSRSLRNAAYSTPSLWSFISLTYPRETVRSLLIMSSDSPLCIYADSGECEVVDGEDGDEEEGGDGDREREEEWGIKVDLVFDEGARIRELEMRITTWGYFKQVPFKDYFKQEAPLLESLSLSISTAEVPKDKRRLPPLKAEKFPRLESLKLDGMSVDWEGSDVCGLRRLEVKNVDGGGKDSFDKFVKRSKGLESCLYGEL